MQLLGQISMQFNTEGLIQRKAGTSRSYMLTEAAHKQPPTNAA